MLTGEESLMLEQSVVGRTGVVLEKSTGMSCSGRLSCAGLGASEGATVVGLEDIPCIRLLLLIFKVFRMMLEDSLHRGYLPGLRLQLGSVAMRDDSTNSLLAVRCEGKTIRAPWKSKSW